MRKNKGVLFFLSLILVLSSFSVSFATVNSEENMTENDDSYEVTIINEEIDKIIMGIENESDRDKVYEFWYTPAYSETKIIDIDSQNNNSIDDSNEGIEIVKDLSALSGEKLDQKIESLLVENSSKLLSKQNIEITDEYLEYVNAFLPDDTIAALQEKALIGNTIVSLENISTASPLAATKTNRKQFKKTYGNSSTFSTCSFYTTVTWKTSGGKITSISTSNTGINTPSHITPTALHRNKTYLSSTKKTGYAQKGWGYVNFYFGGTGLTGYYVLDIKVYGDNSSKYRGETIPTIRWSTYNWGEF